LIDGKDLFKLLAQIPYCNIGGFIKNKNVDGKVKTPSSRRREFRGMMRTYVRRSEHEMKRNAEIGLFTKPCLL
jgi:hypothetical protein